MPDPTVSAADAARALAPEDLDRLLSRAVTLGMVLDAYLEYQEEEGAKMPEHRRRASMWKRFLGADRDPAKVAPKDWREFARRRSSGALDPKGRNIVPRKRQTVRARTVAADLIWLKAALNWAASEWVGDGHYLLEKNPLASSRAFPIPAEKNPRRPIMTEAQYRADLDAAQGQTMHISWGGKRTERPSYLYELLVFAHESWRRISAICELTYADIEPSAPRPDGWPADLPWHGSICWPEDTDKTGKRSVLPLTREMRAAYDRIGRDRPGIGAVPLFPSPRNRKRPITRHYARALLERARRAAGIDGPGWHAYRRKGPTDTRGMSDVDRMMWGGWSDPRTMKRCYEHADMVGAARIVQGREERRHEHDEEAQEA